MVIEDSPSLEVGPDLFLRVFNPVKLWEDEEDQQREEPIPLEHAKAAAAALGKQKIASRRFHVSIRQEGGEIFDIAICDLKEGSEVDVAHCHMPSPSREWRCSPAF